ncbi:hypothetical protein [Limnoglobus roseus]|uniref:Uncharacterized protein n=1 Tax=Limnoglobus roseus TaxID=2598579 RepID=A0A5C1ASJ0_9BACT|nr:hypothetical protein [Limnoglobus roseus]QEL19868.1 hypothetical protein PX52LOC_06949 [Limnoglobus roseus]
MTTAISLDPPSHLTGHHRNTYDAIRRHPTAHNLEWHDVRSLLDAIAVVIEGDNGSLRATRNGHTALLHAPKHKDAPAEMVLAIRRFLEVSATPAAAPTAAAADLLVVIDHHEAKVYRVESHGSVPQKLVPYDPQGHGRHLHSAHEWTDGKRQPERKSYYEAVARTLGGADRIVLFGAGTGRSNAMDQLMADLTARHPTVAAKVIAAVVLEVHHTTEEQLLAEARSVFARFDGVNPVPAEGAR